MLVLCFSAEKLRVRTEKLRQAGDVRIGLFLILHAIYTFQGVRAGVQQRVKFCRMSIRVVDDGYFDSIRKLVQRDFNLRTPYIQMTKNLFTSK